MPDSHIAQCYFAVRYFVKEFRCMKLSEIPIENFRSIRLCHLVLDEITAVIGENNAGKTALLRVLNCFLSFGLIMIEHQLRQAVPKTA